MLAIVLSIVLIAFGYSSLQYVTTYSKVNNQGSFNVTAEGKAEAVPNIAEISLTVLTQSNDNNLAQLQQDNTDKVNNVVEFVKSLDIEDRDIKTSNYNVSPRYSYTNCIAGQDCPPPSISGYSINNTIIVKVRDFSKTSRLLSGAVDNGANSVYGPNFTIDNPENLQSEARAEAIAKAKAKAKSIAQEAGFKLGRVLYISENDFGKGFPLYAEQRASGLGGDTNESASSPTIEPGSQEVLVNVSLTYEIR